uniref:Unannotated protein n=1 Tax=freshwater metagenome TaxID=449393 RepID=A0A6J5ZXG9_9ZZZZ
MASQAAAHAAKCCVTVSGRVNIAFMHRRELLRLVKSLAALGVIAAAALGALSGCGDGAANSQAADAKAEHPPVVLLIFDELPAPTLMKPDHAVDAERYPNFAALEANSTFYHDATTVSDATFAAVPAIFGGWRPVGQHQGKPDREIDMKHTVFTLLSPTYKLNVFEPISYICTRKICPKSTHQDLIPARGKENPGETTGRTQNVLIARTEKAIAAIKTPAPGSKPVAHILHIEMPHPPWRYLPTGQAYRIFDNDKPGLVNPPPTKNDILAGRTQGPPHWIDDQYIVDQGTQRHLLQAANADRILGVIIARLKAAGLWNDALVIATADHGANFLTNELRREARGKSLTQLAGVPIFLKLPGQTTGAASSSSVTTIDILPTIAQQTNLGKNWKFTGIPLNVARPTAGPNVRASGARAQVRESHSQFIAERDAWLATLARRFPAGKEALYRSGPNQELIGAPMPSSLDPTPSGQRAYFSYPPTYANMNPKSKLISAYVSGRLEGVPPKQDLALVVNDRIAAVGRSYQDGSLVHFSMIVPPTSFRKGANTLALLAVKDGKPAWQLGGVGR